MPNEPENSPAPNWSQLNQLTDEQLVVVLLDGVHDALVVLWDRYHRLILNIAIKIVADHGEAEEVVQATFLDVYRALANFDSQKGTLKGWLIQYAYGRALHRRRHLNANRFYSWIQLEHEAIAATSQTAVKSDDLQLIGQLLSRVGTRRRKVIEMTYFEGCTAEEVAERMKLPAATVRHDLYRGLAFLRRSIAKDEQARQEREERQRGELSDGTQSF